MKTVKGLVISRRNVGENDCIIYILTAEHGVMDFYARGVRKMTAKNSSSTQLLAYSTFCLNEQNDKYYLNSSEPIRVFYELRMDTKKYALACYFVEIAQYCVPSGQAARETMKLLLNSLHFLSEGLRSCAFLKSVFEMRFMSDVGLLPQLIGCHECYQYLAEDEMYLMIDRGWLLCGEHFREMGFEEDCDNIRINDTVLHTLRFICLVKPERLFNFKIGEETQAIVSEITEKYMFRHLAKEFKALNVYKYICEETNST